MDLYTALTGNIRNNIFYKTKEGVQMFLDTFPKKWMGGYFLLFSELSINTRIKPMIPNPAETRKAG